MQIYFSLSSSTNSCSLSFCLVSPEIALFTCAIQNGAHPSKSRNPWAYSTNLSIACFLLERAWVVLVKLPWSHIGIIISFCLKGLYILVSTPLSIIVKFSIEGSNAIDEIYEKN